MLQKPLVLVVEDDKQLRELLELSLADQYRLILAEDALKAVEYFQTESPDLILMDIKMPRLNGWEAIREIRSMGINVPIIVITGFSDSWNELLALELGVNRCLWKPFSISKLRELIHKELSMSTKERLETKPDQSKGVRYLYLKGISLWENENLEKALLCFQRAHELNPDDPHIASYLGLVLVNSGIYERGFQLCREALKKKPVDEAAIFNLGQAYLMSSRRNGARLTFLRGARVCDDKQRFLDELTKMGMRRKPIISFLSRDNPLNRWLGKLTYRPGTVPVEQIAC
jgi:CheY-like chemotaxis protein